MEILTKILFKVFQVFASATAGIILGLEAAIPWLGFCFIVIVIDVITAVNLSRRVKRKYPNSGATGKFESRYKLRILMTFIIVFLAIILGNIVDTQLLDGDRIAESSVIWTFLFYEGISILENWSSENDEKAAKVLQRIFVNKAERHMNVPMSDIFFDEEKKKEDVDNGGCK